MKTIYTEKQEVAIKTIESNLVDEQTTKLIPRIDRIASDLLRELGKIEFEETTLEQLEPYDATLGVTVYVDYAVLGYPLRKEIDAVVVLNDNDDHLPLIACNIRRILDTELEHSNRIDSQTFTQSINIKQDQREWQYS